MGGTLSSANHCVSSLLFSCERVSLYGSACVAVTFLLSCMTVLALAGIGAGYNYCYVHFHSVYIDKQPTSTVPYTSWFRWFWRMGLSAAWYFLPFAPFMVRRGGGSRRHTFYAARRDTPRALELLRRLQRAAAPYNLTLRIYQ